MRQRASGGPLVASARRTTSARLATVAQDDATGRERAQLEPFARAHCRATRRERLAAPYKRRRRQDLTLGPRTEGTDTNLIISPAVPAHEVVQRATALRAAPPAPATGWDVAVRAEPCPQARAPISSVCPVLNGRSVRTLQICPWLVSMAHRISSDLSVARVWSDPIRCVRICQILSVVRIRQILSVACLRACSAQALRSKIRFHVAPWVARDGSSARLSQRSTQVNREVAPCACLCSEEA